MSLERVSRVDDTKYVAIVSLNFRRGNSAVYLRGCALCGCPVMERRGGGMEDVRACSEGSPEGSSWYGRDK